MEADEQVGPTDQQHARDEEKTQINPDRISMKHFKMKLSINYCGLK